MKNEKNIKKTNALIKRKNLITRLKKEGITRASLVVVKGIEKEIDKHLLSILVLLKEELIVNGRKTLKKEDVLNAVKKLKNKEDYWEV